MRRALLGLCLGLIGAFSCVGPAAASHKGPVAASQMPALTGDCATATGAIAVSCTGLRGQANIWVTGQQFGVSANGYLTMNDGSGTASGYMAVFNSAGTRLGFFGFQNGQLGINADGTNPICFYGSGGTASELCVLTQGEVVFKGGEDHVTASVSASFTFDATMQMRVADATSAPVVGTLPACTASINGREYTLVKADTSTNAVSFAPNGTDKISGTNASLSVGTTQGSAINLRCNGNGTGVTAGWWRH